MLPPEDLPHRLCALPRFWAARSPQAPALAEPGRAWSFAQLAAAVGAAELLLRQLELRAGDRLMLVSENCMAQVALLFAAAALDVWVVGVNPRLSAPEVAAISSHCGARRAIFTSAVSAEAAAHGARAGAAALDCAWLGPLMAGPLDRACAPEPVAADGALQVAALLYTSGTTGQPKGVMLTHRNLLFVAAVSSRLRGLTPADRVCAVLPITHVYGLASVMLGTLYAGASLYLMPRFAPQALLAALEAQRLTILQGVPAMYVRLLEALGGAAPRAPLRFIYAGGSPLDPALKRAVERVFGLPLHNGYGMTESGPTISQTRLEAPRGDASVGLAIPGIAVRLVGADGADCGPGAPGELWVRGPNVMLGYYRAAPLTAAALGPDGWLRTGDVARRDADGALFIVGRSKELIIRSGFNVYPLEVETVLNAHPAVLQSAVVGRAVADGNEEVVAFVELDALRLPGAPDLQAWLAQSLAPYKRPAEIIVMAALPAAATGKILKAQLKALAAEGPAPIPARACGPLK